MVFAKEKKGIRRKLKSLKFPSFIKNSRLYENIFHLTSLTAGHKMLNIVPGLASEFHKS